MPKPPPGGVMDDEAAHLYQRFLYVEPIYYPIDLDAVPKDGHEYIHQVRLETEKIFPGQRNKYHECEPVFFIKKHDDDTSKNKVLTLNEWKRKECIFFTELALLLKSKRNVMMEKFPQSQVLPSCQNKKNVCLFCLGSNLYRKIFKTDELHEIPGNDPLLSLVLHFSQKEIYKIIQYMTEWLLEADFAYEIGQWIYVLFLCLHKPIPDEWEEFLEDFYDSLENHKQHPNKMKKKLIHLLSFILKTYFCVKAYALGPSLDSFVQE